MLHTQREKLQFHQQHSIQPQEKAWHKEILSRMSGENASWSTYRFHLTLCPSTPTMYLACMGTRVLSISRSHTFSYTRIISRADIADWEGVAPPRGYSGRSTHHQTIALMLTDCSPHRSIDQLIGFSIDLPINRSIFPLIYQSIDRLILKRMVHHRLSPRTNGCYKPFRATA